MKTPTLKLLKDRCEDQSGRWIWQQMSNESGVPQVKIGLRNVSVYRVAYCLANGLELAALGTDVIWPTTEQGDINPAHLMRGTRPELRAWRKAQGLTKRSPAAIASVTASARARPSNKTTPAMIEVIRSSDEPAHVVAARIGLARSTVSKIRAGTMWGAQLPQASVFQLGAV